MSRSRHIVVGAVLLAVVAFRPSPAWAELPRPFGLTTGFMLEGGFGGNGITSDDYIDNSSATDIDIGPLVGLFLSGAYRPIDWVSVGLLAHYGFLAADFEDVDDDVAGFFGLLVEVRGRLPMSRVDPWVGFGFGYAMTFSHGWGDVNVPILGDVEYDGKVVLHGVGLGIGVGVDIFITRQFALAPFFRMIFGVYPGGCAEYTLGDSHDEVCDDLEDLYNDNEPDDLPHLWIVGLAATYVVD
jgi:hypothetical protein